MPSAHLDRLATYHQKRDFDITSEPHGGDVAHATGDGFVIQCHAARRRHYDFRLELDGVLLSWSVPKGPSLDPKERRLAVRTEDHPLDYASFEGIIPPKQYGAGGVIVWDQGRWTPQGDPRAALAKGHLVFELHGTKLLGRWHLVRTRGGERDKQNWLLFKGKDEHADATRDIVAEAPTSVVSGRTVEQVIEAPDRVWHSNRSPGGQINDLLKGLPLGFQLTNLDKVLYPEQGLTKGQVVAYLAVVADRMMPYVRERPLMLLRCPEGSAKPCFVQKHTKPGTPPPIHSTRIKGSDGLVEEHMFVDDMAGVLGLAQLGALEIHTWAGRVDKLERPDRLVMDLDPDPSVPWSSVVEAALVVRELLHRLDLESFVTTTGGKGVHIVAPLTRRADWDEHKEAARAVAEAMVALDRKRFIATATKAARKGKIFVDWLRNGRGATFIAPYSMRARSGAPVATPITWDELTTVDPQAFTIETVPRRVHAHPDPWAAMATTRQTLRAAALARLVRVSQK
ncbi:MAG TPA: non-homologous end-joining DNA ligase [Kofleriaceae bacterium]|nr:non-homologous end-joining DNA ligase [Kofleriaceae bacterium]